MGGWGSGMGMRFNTTRTKRFVEEFASIDSRDFSFASMRKLPDDGDFSIILGLHAIVSRNQIDFHHCHGGVHRRFQIQFAQVRGNYGNPRYMMLCPGPTCSRRCVKLYRYPLSDGCPAVLCRSCLNLAYRSQNKTYLDRLATKKWGLIHELGADSDSIWDHQKPKWMHWKTFKYIRTRIADLDHLGLMVSCAKFGISPC